MNRFKSMVLGFFAILPFLSNGQVTVEDYARAEKFLQRNLEKSIYNRWVEPTWESDGNLFVYSVKTRNGTEFFKVNPSNKQKNVAFDHSKLALLLTDSLKEEVKPYELPISKIEIAGKNEYTIWAKEKQWTYNLTKNFLTPVTDEPKLSEKESLSPDENWIAFIKDGNLFLKDKNTDEEFQLTNDGTPENGYGYNLDWYETRNDSKEEKDNFSIEVYWSDDSKKIIVPKFDRRNTRRLQLYKTDVEGYQSEIISYERELAGDSIVTMADFFVFDVDQKEGIRINLPLNPAFLGTEFYTFEDCPKAYHVKYYRGYKTRELFEIDLETGRARSILTENYPKTFVDLYTETLEVIYDKNEFIWRSEQDGWCHLYRYDLSTGKIKNQITKGSFYVYDIEHVDEKSETIWFMAGGADPNKDPYQKYLYSIGFDGKNQKLLTPEEATHDIRISPDTKYFVDNYSSHKDPNITVVRNLKNGKLVMGVEKTDIDDLVKMGWKPAETFSMLADDGETMLYGTIIKPTNFNPNKKYPVIDGTYTGPHTIRAPKTFSRSVLNMDLSLAELGFIVVNIVGRGSAYRSRAFHDVSYARLGYGLVDHVYVIKKLAEKYSYIDADRVGIYGHSAEVMMQHALYSYFPIFIKLVFHRLAIMITEWRKSGGLNYTKDFL